MKLTSPKLTNRKRTRRSRDLKLPCGMEALAKKREEGMHRSQKKATPPDVSTTSAAYSTRWTDSQGEQASCATESTSSSCTHTTLKTLGAANSALPEGLFAYVSQSVDSSPQPPAKCARHFSISPAAPSTAMSASSSLRTTAPE